jgi:hypothetical protein
MRLIEFAADFVNRGLVEMMRYVVCLVLLFVMDSSAIAQNTISDLSPITPDDIETKSEIKFGVDDADTSTSKRIHIGEVAEVVLSHRITATSHGLSASDEGKPLYDDGIYDNTDSAERPDWILVQNVDTNTLRVIGQGGLVTVPVTLLDGGAAYSIATSGRQVYWDTTNTQYTATLPSDHDGPAKYILTILSVGASDFTAIVDIRSDTSSQVTTDVLVRGTGASAVDDVRFGAAVTQLNAAGGGRIFVSGTLQLASNHDFTTPVSIIGIPGTNAGIEQVDLGGLLRWNANYSPFSESTTTIAATAERASIIEVATGTLEVGQWFFVRSDDDMTGITAHTPGTPHRPFEVHQVKEIRASSGGTDYIVF